MSSLRSGAPACGLLAGRRALRGEDGQRYGKGLVNLCCRDFVHGRGTTLEAVRDQISLSRVELKPTVRKW